MWRNISVRIILFTLIGLISYNLNGQGIGDTSGVYIISSFGSTNEWGQILAKKIKKEIGNTSYPNHIEIIYSGVDKAADMAQAREMLNPGIWKERTPALVIVIGYEAWMTLRSFNDPLLIAAPAVVCGIETTELGDWNYFLLNKNVPDSGLVTADSLLSGYNAVAVTRQDNTANTIRELTRLFPQVRNILYISEQSYSDSRYAQRIENILENEYPELHFSTLKTGYVTEKFLNSLKQRVDEKNTALILNNYNIPENPSGNPGDADVLETPVFLLKYKDVRNTHNMVGGIFEPADAYAGKIVSAAKNLLSGNKPSAVQEDRAAPVNIINKSAALRFDAKLKKLKEAVFVNEPESRNIQEVISIVVYTILPGLFILGLLVMIRVLIKRKRTLRETEKYAETVKKYNAVYANLPIGIASFKPDGKFCEGNAEFMKIIRAFIPDFRLSSHFNLFNTPLVDDRIIRLIETKETAEKEISRDINGSPFTARLLFTVLTEPDSILVTIFDTTQTTLEREKRDNINSIFEKAIGESKLGVAELNFSTGRCIATDGWYKGLNIQKDATVEECFSNLVAEDKERIMLFIRQALRDEADKATEDVRILNADSNFHWLKLLFTIKERDPESNNIVCSAILVDTDARKQKEEQLKETYTRIVNANRVKNSFLSNMSNEIRTPLNAIVGFSELIIESTDAAEQKELVKYLNENNEKFLKLISDIVDMSKIESGAMKCTLSDVDINELLNEIVKTSIPQVDPGKVNIVFSPTENCIVYSDRERLQQVLSTFMSNAVKFTGEGTIEIGYRLLSKKIQLYVKDTGCGVDPEKREYLFNHLNRNSSEYRGWGMGLAVASSIIKLLKGEIGFESEIGKGSTFWCTIPSEYIGTDTQMGLTGKLESATIHLGSNLKTMLIAEDNENNFQLLNFILKGKFKIIHAINGEKAVELFKAHHPDIILMDIKMPVMDGYQATAAIREISADVPIIAVTAYAFNNDKEKILDSSFSGFIAKPVREKELMETINDIFNK